MIRQLRGVQEKQVRIILLKLMLVGQCLTLFFINCFWTEQLVERDTALAIRHAIEIWKNGFFLESYQYYSTMEIDCASFFAVPLYFLTGQLGLALAIVHTFLYGVFWVVIKGIAQKIHKTQQQAMMAQFILFSLYSLRELDWAMMVCLVVGQYEFRILTMLLLVYVLLCVENNGFSEKKTKWLLLGYFVVNFWVSFSAGNYVFCMILLPFWLYVIGKQIIHHHIKPFSCEIQVMMISTVISIIGWRLHDIIAGVSFRNNLMLITQQEFMKNIENAIVGIFSLFGTPPYDADISIFSPKGILALARMGFVLFCFFVVYVKSKHKKEKHSLFWMFISVTVVNLGVLIVTDTRYGSDFFEARYHILWCTMMLLCVGMGLEVLQDKWLNYLMFWGALLVVVFINVGGIAQAYTIDRYKSTIERIQKEIDSYQPQALYIYDGIPEAAYIRLYYPQQPCVSVTVQGNIINYQTDNFYRDYYNILEDLKTTVLVASEGEFYTLPISIQQVYTQVQKLENGDVIYYSTQNPWKNTV